MQYLLAIYQKVLFDENHAMDTQSHRKLRLRELIDHACGGFISVMAAKIGKADSYVSRMLYSPDKKGAKPVGDKMMLAIEAAFELERAWLDMPLGYDLPLAPSPPPVTGEGAQAHQVAEPSGRYVTGQSPIGWPFKLVSYPRLIALEKALGSKRGPDAIRDIDKHLEIVTLKWEREAQLAVKSRAA